jgi:hypothetical protein
MRGWLKDYIIPGVSALVVGTGMVVRNEMEVSRLDRENKDLRAKVDRLGDFGTDGFRDPNIHAALDLHIQCFLRELQVIDRRTWKSWHDAFFQLNPTLTRPLAVSENHEAGIDKDWRP